jgi:hypothetical protein
MKTLGTLALAGIVALAVLPAAVGAQTVGIGGSEATGLTRTLDGDGSVRIVGLAAYNGLVATDAGLWALGSAQFTMTVVQAGDELRSATLVYTQYGRRGASASVTIDIDPCWFELSNERDFTSEDFGEDIRKKVEAALPAGAALDPAVKTWLEQRLSLLSARMAEPNLKAGIVLVPPRG